eukprot:m.14326 g.14326  ORF g.14326 m.14326 type:complete len:67 (-) comp4776_c0_seq2:141-341(-)
MRALVHLYQNQAATASMVAQALIQAPTVDVTTGITRSDLVPFIPPKVGPMLARTLAKGSDRLQSTA